MDGVHIHGQYHLYSFDSADVPETSFMICLLGKCCTDLQNPQQAVKQSLNRQPSLTWLFLNE